MNCNHQEAFNTPLTTLKAAKAFIHWLGQNEMSFHFEDDPADIIDATTKLPVFDAKSSALLRQRVTELYSFDWGDFECPIGFALTVWEF